MKPKEKAEELVEKFYSRATSYSLDRKNQNENAKQCALIAQKIVLNKLKSLNIKDEFEEAVLFEINVL
jgi:hypothetical protein